jgi:hypothetical protein
LTAQLKAAVEQLDTLVLSFEDVARYIEPSVWPEINAKSDLKTFLMKDMLAGRQQEIHAERDRKLEQARNQRQIRRHQADHLGDN